jgi:hypothetical protein
MSIFVVNLSLTTNWSESTPSSGLGRHGEIGSLRKLLDGQDQQCGRHSDAQPRTVE